MIAMPPGVRVWIATGHTDMRRGMNTLACWCRKPSSATRTAAISTCSAAKAAS